MDHRLQNLSFSSLTTLHSCPRKWQLNRLQSRREPIKNLEDDYSPVTFAFGHTVGAGVQLLLSPAHEIEITKSSPVLMASLTVADPTDMVLDSIPGDINTEGLSGTVAALERAPKYKYTIPSTYNLTPEQRTIFGMFLTWEVDLDARDDKRKKSFYLAVAAIQKLAVIKDFLLKDYELVYYNGKPATELGFCINFPDGFKLRGFVDAVLRNKNTGKIIVLECKTSSFTEIPPAIFKNSAQAIGYSIVLDVLFPDLSSYEVLYLIYKSKSFEWNPLPFEKNYLQRALWIQELLLDIETIKMYEEIGVYPMRGESCYSWFRDCEYLNVCTLATNRLTTPEPPMKSNEVFDINLTIADLVTAQLEKA